MRLIRFRAGKKRDKEEARLLKEEQVKQSRADSNGAEQAKDSGKPVLPLRQPGAAIREWRRRRREKNQPAPEKM